MYHIQTPLKQKRYRAYGVIVHIRTKKQKPPSNQAVAVAGVASALAAAGSTDTSGHGFLIAS